MSKPRGNGASRSADEARAPGARGFNRAGQRAANVMTPAAREHHRYRSFFDDLFVGVFQSTLDGRLLAANRAMVEMLGYDSEEELLGLDITRQIYYDPGDRDGIVRRAGEAGELRNHELALRMKDGTRVVVLVSSRAVRDEHGAIRHMEGTLTNITAWHDAEGLFRVLAEDSPVGIFIAQHTRFIFVNQTFAKMTGYTREELLATGPLQLLHDDERERVLGDAIEMLAGRREEAFEHWVRRKDGESRCALATITAIQHHRRPAVLGNFVDITERKQAQDLFQSLAASSPVAIFILQDHRFMFVNPQMVQITGRSESELLRMHLFDVVEEDDRERLREMAEAVITGQALRTFEHRIINQVTGELRWVLDTATPIVYRGRPAVLGNSIDITERKLAEGQLARQAFYDSLTGLPNRALFMERLEHALAASKRRHKPVAVMFLDLDNFKDVNDTFGHAAGDDLLVALALRLQTCVRPMDTVARIGGDEFTVLLDATDWRHDALAVAERVVDELKRPFDVVGQRAFVRASIGVAFSDPDRHSAAAVLLREADVALYHAKSAGKGRYVVFGEEWKAA